MPFQTQTARGFAARHRFDDASPLFAATEGFLHLGPHTTSQCSAVAWLHKNIANRAVFAIVLAMAPWTALGEVTMGEPVKLTPDRDAHRSGRRIRFTVEMVEFHVPLFAHVTKF